MAIDEQQAEPAAAPQRKHRAEQDRAVASENQCEFTTVQHMCGRVRELRAPLRDGACVSSSSVSVSVETVRWRFYTPGMARVETLGEAVLEQCAREAIDAGRLKTQNRRGFDNCAASRHMASPPHLRPSSYRAPEAARAGFIDLSPILSLRVA